MQLNPGTVIGRYTVEEMIGEGGMATVYRVQHNELHAAYALKVLNLVSDAIQRRLVQEGRVQARLRHPNILPVTDILDIGGRPGLIMEYVDGPSLEIKLATHHLSLDEADELALGILSAVAFAHSQGVVHRDLKPANILLADYGGDLIPKVADFGLVKVLGDDDSLHKTRSGIGIGTPCYMAPEQALDAAHVDERADVFSLGAILYELVCGRRAFHGPNTVAIIIRIAAGQFTPPEELRPDLPKRMLNAIHGAMQIDRNLRIQDSQTLREVWRGKKDWRAPAAPAAPDATWSDEDLLGPADAGVAGLQDIIRSIAEQNAVEGPPPTLAAPAASISEPARQVGLGPAPTVGQPGVAATAVPPESLVPPPPRLPTMDLSPLLDSTPGPEAEPGDGTLADDLPLVHGERDGDGGKDRPEPSEPELSAAGTPSPPVAMRFTSEPAAVPTDSAHSSSHAADQDEPESRGIGLLPKLMVVAGLLLALGVGGAFVGSFIIFTEHDSNSDEVLEASEPTPTVDATSVVPTESPPSGENTDTPDKSAVTRVAPTTDIGEGTSPEEEPVPTAGTSSAEPAVTTAPGGVDRAPPPIKTGRVEVTGDMVSAVLISSSGRRRSPGEVPVGTYDLEVSFANGKTVTRTDMVQVTTGSTTAIKCFARVENCR